MSDYITREALAAEVGGDDNRDQMKLDAAKSAASRQVEHHCGRRFWIDQAETIREFYPSTYLLVDLLEQPGSDPKVEIPSTETVLDNLVIRVDSSGDGSFSTTLTDSDYLLLPRNASADGRPYSEILSTGNVHFPCLTNGRAAVQVVSKFGWNTVPDEVVRATMLQAVYLFKSADAPLGIAQFGPDGAGMRLSNAPLHRAAAGLLAGLQRPPIG